MSLKQCSLINIEILMTIRTLLTISSITMIFLGLLFLIFPEYISVKMFPEAGEEQIHIAIVHRQIMSGGCFFIGICYKRS